MRFLKLIFASKKKNVKCNISEKSYRYTEVYSSQEMIQMASDWTRNFIHSAPRLKNAIYQKDEIYMFCCWVLIDYGTNYGYLGRNINRDEFYATIFQAVRNTGTYKQSEMEQFTFRVGQYKWQIGEMLKCDYPRTKIFFPETLYARFVEIDFDHYTPCFDGIDESLIMFSEFLGIFWNKINRELMEKYPYKK